MRKALFIGLVALVAVGCHRGAGRTAATEYETVAKDPHRDADKARARNAEAVRLIEAGRLEEAETALKQALEADVMCGQAHNNLGLVYFRQKRLYLAAWEFQYAAKLLDHSPQPRNNLGLVFETIGRLDDAEKEYDQALALEEDNPEVAGNLARVLVRTGRKDDRTRELLEDVAMKDSRPDWVDWAREHLVMMGKHEPRAAILPAEETPTADQPKVAEPEPQ